jgi:hypothetical protein
VGSINIILKKNSNINSMTSYKILKISFFIFINALLVTSCTKVETPAPLGDKGQSIVKFLGGLADTANGYSAGYKIINIDLVSTPQVLEMADIRRDVPNNAELNKTMNITIKNDPGIASSYSSDFLPLPPGSYTVDAAIPVIGNDYKVTIQQGEFSKLIKITLNNALALDLNKKYAVGFIITSTDADGKLAKLESSLVVEIGVKNKYDGVYKVSGTFYHPTNAALVGPFGTASSGGDLECDMLTTGSNSLNRDYGGAVGESVIVYNSTSAAFTYFTGVKMRFAVDPSTNIVTLSPAPGSIAPDPSPYDCTYNPSSKTFTLNYGWTSGAQRRITEVLRYLRPR